MKRAVVKVIFDKLELDAVADSEQAVVESHALTEGVAGLVEVGATGQIARATGNNSEGDSLVEEAAFDEATDADLLAVVLRSGVQVRPPWWS